VEDPPRKLSAGPGSRRATCPGKRARRSLVTKAALERLSNPTGIATAARTIDTISISVLTPDSIGSRRSGRPNHHPDCVDRIGARRGQRFRCVAPSIMALSPPVSDRGSSGTEGIRLVSRPGLPTFTYRKAHCTYRRDARSGPLTPSGRCPNGRSWKSAPPPGCEPQLAHRRDLPMIFHPTCTRMTPGDGRKPRKLSRRADLFKWVFLLAGALEEL
jgi:hypothetical protein